MAVPTTTWSAPTPMLRALNRTARKTPAPSAATAPTQGLCAAWEAAKPASAPASIMPSMPTLITPAFSTINSPSAASSNGTARLTPMVSRLVRMSSTLSVLSFAGDLFQMPRLGVLQIGQAFSLRRIRRASARVRSVVATRIV